jgi:predicted metal-dependent phosphoesterase TrpH
LTNGDAFRLGKADMHIHTIASDGTASVAAILEHVERNTDLDVIAIADHERIEAAVEGRRLALASGGRVEVVVGEEVTTRSGHLLGLFLQSRLLRNQRLETTVAEIHEQGGLAIVPHPFSAFTRGMRKHAIMRVHNSPDPRVYWDALEGFNPSTAGRYGRAATARLAAELGLPLVGNSDAHTLETIGDGRTHFPGSTAEDYRRAVMTGTTSGSCDDWGFVRDVVRWGRRHVLRDGTPRDLGVPPDQLLIQHQDDERGTGARLRAQRMATSDGREAQEPPA